MLQPWLEERGLGGNTQVLVYFAVAKKGESPVDGRTDLNPEGLTAAWGPHAHAFADRLASGGLTCKVRPLLTAHYARMFTKSKRQGCYLLGRAASGSTVVFRSHNSRPGMVT
jgi:hypothetical protein